MEPRFFGSPPLFGLYDRPATAWASRDSAVLVCPPIGHEHTRAHRALRILSEALLRAGFPVLRFDYRGTGDSGGRFDDGDVGSWCEDIAAALDELRVLSAARGVHVIGLRVGSTLAAKALAERSDSRRSFAVRTLTLWDPVVSGQDFLGTAARLQSAFSRDAGRFPGGSAPPPSMAAPEAHELLGHWYSAGLCRSLRGLDLLGLQDWPVALVHLVLSAPSPTGDELVARLRARGRVVDRQFVQGADPAWEDYAAHEHSLRAGTVIRAIVAQLEKHG